MRVQRVGLAGGCYTDGVLLNTANFEWVITSGPLRAAAAVYCTTCCVCDVMILPATTADTKSIRCYGYEVYNNIIHLQQYNYLLLTGNGDCDAIGTRRQRRRPRRPREQRHSSAVVHYHNILLGIRRRKILYRKRTKRNKTIFKIKQIKKKKIARRSYDDYNIIIFDDVVCDDCL